MVWTVSPTFVYLGRTKEADTELTKPLPHASATGSSHDKLQDVVRRLVEVYAPERIYLFGSTARGDWHEDSDLDIMVVVSDDTPESHRSAGLAYRALWGVGVAVDVLIWTRSAFDERLHLNASLPATIVREGQLLHAA